MSRVVAQSLGRIVVIAFVLIMLLALVTASKFAAIRARRLPSGRSAVVLKPIKGDVRRRDDGKLQYFDGRKWSDTPPPPKDDAF